MQNNRCFNCVHYIAGLHCKAFMEIKIPEKILLGKNKHTKPLKTQGNNIVFEKK